MNRWLEIALQFVPHEITPLDGAEILSDNGISIVYRWNGDIYKRSIPFLTTNELFVLKKLQHTGYVPKSWSVDRFTIGMEDLGETEPVSDVKFFMLHKELLLSVLEKKGVRHGDLTTANIIVKNNHPYIIDWAESRLACDTRPDKRPQGDRYWIEKTWKELCKI